MKLTESWNINNLNALINYFESKEWQREFLNSTDYYGEEWRVEQVFQKHKIKCKPHHHGDTKYLHIMITEPSDGKYAVCFIRGKNWYKFLRDMPDSTFISNFRKIVNLFTNTMKDGKGGILRKFINKLYKGTEVDRYYDGDWIKVVILDTDIMENTMKINEVKIKQDRYIRNHGKPLRVSGTATIAFTNKQSGDVNYKNPKEFFSPKSGNKSDVMKQAKEWAKQNGYDTIYIMENSTMKITKSEIRNIIREELERFILTEWRAEEVIKQLGGNKFIAMTGAKQFVKSDKDKQITFKIGGGAKNGINYIRITLTSMDLYNVEFLRLRGNELKVVASVDGVYNDQLQSIFTKHTGMRTSL